MRFPFTVMLLVVLLLAKATARENCPGATDCLSAQILKSSTSSKGNHETKNWNVEHSIGYYYFGQKLRGDPNNFRIASLTPEIGRRFNRKTPGDYLQAPRLSISKDYRSFPLEKTERPILDDYLSALLKPEYYSKSISNCVEKYISVLNDSTRNEFYGRFTIGGQKFTFGGWFDKFAVVGIFGKYENVDEFIELARKHLKIRPIAPEEISVKREGERYFYELLDKEGKFMLRGFEVRLVNLDNEMDHIFADVIEFTKYYDEEFVP